MFRRKEVERILEQARRMDPKLELFGVSDHQYRLGSPVDLSFVLSIEEEYHFRFPEDYVQFITEVGDGGAGPGYGLYAFGFYQTEPKSSRDAKIRDSYLRGLSREPRLLPLEPDDLKYSCISEDEYKQNPEKYFVTGNFNWDNDTPYGFFHLGTYGCACDYGLITAGERRGQVFRYDVECGFELEACSFQAFYQEWLDAVSDTERFQKEVDEWRRIRNR